MNTQGMTKYLILVMMMMSINIPLFFYSRSFLKPSNTENAVTVEQQTAEVNALATNDTSPQNLQEPEKPTEALSKTDKAEPSNQLQDLPKSRSEPAPLANLYRPPLLGKCKKLFERFSKQKDPDKPYRAFVYSFNGETAYCAGAVTDKSQEQAEKIAKKDCEDNQASTGKYSPCRIYTSEETN
jgi:hypothetical protein